jgi:tripartite-type tricarboxylate transporter receptor subunit TctC
VTHVAQRRRVPMRFLGIAVAGTLAFWPCGPMAQVISDAAAFPNRLIKIVVPFPAGGGTDILARLVGQRMTEDWGQPVVIENRPGANTAIGAQVVARSAPDGYTLLAAMDVTMVMNTASGASMSYDPVRDFAPVTLLAKNGALLGVRASDGARTLQELIAKGKSNSRSMTFGAGVTITRLAGFMFTKAAGFEAVMIPYKGSAETLQGLLAGSVDFVVDGIGTVLPLVKSGNVRALAKLDARPLPSLPDLPTLAVAASLPQFEDITAWTALVVPAGTPAAIVDKLQREVVRIYSDPRTVERLAALEIAAVTSTPSELGDFHRRELARWSQVFKENKLDF